MLAVEQPSSIWNSCCFDWTSSAHISLGSGMPKHAKIVPITAGRLNSQEPHKELMVPIRNGSVVQISFSELLPRYLQDQEAHKRARSKTSARTRGKIIYLPKRSSDDSCSA